MSSYDSGNLFRWKNASTLVNLHADFHVLDFYADVKQWGEQCITIKGSIWKHLLH